MKGKRNTIKFNLSGKYIKKIYKKKKKNKTKQFVEFFFFSEKKNPYQSTSFYSQVICFKNQIYFFVFWCDQKEKKRNEQT